MGLVVVLIKVVGVVLCRYGFRNGVDVVKVGKKLVLCFSVVVFGVDRLVGTRL